MINVRTWLICLSQNARLTAVTVITLEVACAVCGLAAMKAMHIKPTTEPAIVSNQQIRYLVLLLLCWPVGHYGLLLIYLSNS